MGLINWEVELKVWGGIDQINRNNSVLLHTVALGDPRPLFRRAQSGHTMIWG